MKIGSLEIPMDTLWQIAKFLAVGFLNTFIDFLVLNVLMFATAITSGPYFPILKIISFLFAVTNSFLLNKFWTFKSRDRDTAGGESMKFLLVSLVGLSINVSIASSVVNYVPRPDFLSPVLWANFGSAVAVAVALFWNFLGYKMLVFKK